MEDQIKTIVEIIDKLSNATKIEETKVTLNKLNNAIKKKFMGPEEAKNNVSNDSTKECISNVINVIEQKRIGGYIHYRTLIDNLHIGFNVDKSTIDEIMSKRLK